MKNRKDYILLVSVGVFAVLILVACFAVPLGSYTTVNGCPSEDTPAVRLSLVRGESLDDIRSQDVPNDNPLVGCSQNATYTQYIF